MNKWFIRNMGVLAYTNGFTYWHYKHPGQLADVLETSFFTPATDVLAVGDMILVSALDGGAMLFVDTISEDIGVWVKPMCSTKAAS